VCGKVNCYKFPRHSNFISCKLPRRDHLLLSPVIDELLVYLIFQFVRLTQNIFFNLIKSREIIIRSLRRPMIFNHAYYLVSSHVKTLFVFTFYSNLVWHLFWLHSMNYSHNNIFVLSIYRQWWIVTQQYIVQIRYILDHCSWDALSNSKL
jgi:hypothetical protein